jgi:hypothetical protein
MANLVSKEVVTKIVEHTYVLELTEEEFAFFAAICGKSKKANPWYPITGKMWASVFSEYYEEIWSESNHPYNKAKELLKDVTF